MRKKVISRYLSQETYEHTFEPNRYPSLFKNVKMIEDGEVFGLNGDA